MICPHCLAHIDDEAAVCPHCHTEVSARTARLVFCEGCGARLSPHDRTCPKCGRPAPGILSTGASASDLAAGKTASFPRLTQSAIETELPHAEPVTARRVVDDSLDPSATNVLDLDRIRERGAASGRSANDDPYHARKRSKKAIVSALAVIAVISGSAFVALDPLGAMPGIYAWVQNSASEMFPSRMGPSNDDVQGDEGDAQEDNAPADAEQTLQDEALSEDAAFQQISQAYDAVVAINNGERFGEAIDSFNAWYLSSSLAKRQDASSGAFALRDELQGIIDELDAMELVDGSAYVEDRDNVRQLAAWMYERIDAICDSWDISLSFPDGESMSQHQDEILQPLRAAGNTARDNYYEHVSEWQPMEK